MKNIFYDNILCFIINVIHTKLLNGFTFLRFANPHLLFYLLHQVLQLLKKLPYKKKYSIHFSLLNMISRIVLRTSR